MGETLPVLPPYCFTVNLIFQPFSQPWEDNLTIGDLVSKETGCCVSGKVKSE